MQTTKKSINEQIEEVHKLFDEAYSKATNCETGCAVLHHHMKIIIQHVMKLEAKAYYINKKLDQALGLAPKD